MPPSEPPSTTQEARVPTQRDRAGKDLSVAQLTAKAELVMEELAGVIADMAGLLRKGAQDAGSAE